MINKNYAILEIASKNAVQLLLLEKSEPKINKLYRPEIRQAFSRAKSRCNSHSPRNTKYYIDKGIKFELTLNDVLFLWFRDNADYLNNASLDRKDSNKNYTLNNCRFIEWEQNRKINKLKNN